MTSFNLEAEILASITPEEAVLYLNNHPYGANTGDMKGLWMHCLNLTINKNLECFIGEKVCGPTVNQVREKIESVYRRYYVPVSERQGLSYDIV